MGLHFLSFVFLLFGYLYNVMKTFTDLFDKYLTITALQEEVGLVHFYNSSLMNEIRERKEHHIAEIRDYEKGERDFESVDEYLDATIRKLHRELDYLKRHPDPLLKTP